MEAKPLDFNELNDDQKEVVFKMLLGGGYHDILISNVMALIDEKDNVIGYRLLQQSESHKNEIWDKSIRRGSEIRSGSLIKSAIWDYDEFKLFRHYYRAGRQYIFNIRSLLDKIHNNKDLARRIKAGFIFCEDVA